MFRFGLMVRNIKISKPQDELTEVEFKLIQAVMKEQTRN